MTNDTQEPAEPRPSLIRRHPFAYGIAGVLVAVVVLSGLTAWGVATAVESHASMASTASPMPTASGAPKGKKPANAARGIRGTITAINGSTWTVVTKAGPTVSVAVTSTTVFGTKQAPETASAFTTGSSIVVLGTRSGDSLVATRVIMPKDGAGVTPTPSASPNA